MRDYKDDYFDAAVAAANNERETDAVLAFLVRLFTEMGVTAEGWKGNYRRLGAEITRRYMLTGPHHDV